MHRATVDVTRDQGAPGGPGSPAGRVFPAAGPAFVRAEGATLFDAEGRRFLDAAAGGCPLGHGHPRLIAAARSFLRERVPNLMHVAPSPHAARLGRELSQLAERSGAPLDVALFATSGAEALEAALKHARAATGRAPLLRCHGAHHGLTLGALSVSDHPRALDPLLPSCHAVPFDDDAALGDALRSLRPAAFVVEPAQLAAGLRLPRSGYLKRARALCREHGALLVLDETHTAFGRAGAPFAFQAAGLTGADAPDVVVAGRALGGGLAPIAAALARGSAHDRSFGRMDRFDLHGSTFAGNALSCAVGAAVLAIIQSDRLCESAGARGRALLSGIEARAGSLVAAVRGVGLQIAIELRAGEGRDAAWLARALLARSVVAEPASSAPQVLLLAPPLIVTEAEVAQLVEAVGSALGDGASAHPTEEGSKP
jgi:putrescine aminotransferase